MTDPDQLRTEIAQTRQDLAETVDELSHRVSPRERARSAVNTTKDTVQTHRPQVAIASGAVVSSVLVVWLIKRRRSS